MYFDSIFCRKLHRRFCKIASSNEDTRICFHRYDRCIEFLQRWSPDEFVLRIALAFNEGRLSVLFEYQVSPEIITHGSLFYGIVQFPVHFGNDTFKLFWRQA